MKQRSDYHGILGVDKPKGITSHDVVSRIRQLFETRRVGHAGTLDPMATGVLVLCLGDATRIVEYLTAARKTYIAGFTFGVSTDTEDSTGHMISESDASSVSESGLLDVMREFRGKIKQIPPMVSAVHHE